MEISVSKNNYIFIEDTVFVYPNFYLLLKEYIESGGTDLHYRRYSQLPAY